MIVRNIIVENFRGFRGSAAVDLATGSSEEIDSLIEEIELADSAEDEIALHGELRYVHRLLPVTPASMKGLVRTVTDLPNAFRFDIKVYAKRKSSNRQLRTPSPSGFRRIGSARS